MQKIPVKNETLVRDAATGAILETDMTALNRHRAIRQSIKDKDMKVDLLLEKINNLESLIERITHGRDNT